MPRAVVHLAAENRRALVNMLRLLLQPVVALFDSIEKCIGLLLPANEHSDQFHPLGLSQGVGLLIAQVGHERDARLADGVVAAALRGRDEDDVRVGGENELRVELTLHTNLDDAAVLHSFEDVLVEEVLRARDAFHHVGGGEHGEVRQLKRGHADGALDGHPHLRVAVGHSGVFGADECEVVFLANIDQSHAEGITHAEACGVLDADADGGVGRRFVARRLLSGALS